MTVHRTATQLLDLLQTVKVGGLFGFDGCPCGHIDLLGIGIDTACGRGRDASVYVYETTNFGVQRDILRVIGEEVRKQIEEWSGRELPVTVGRYEDSIEAAATAAWQKMNPPPRPFSDFYRQFREAHKAQSNGEI